ncbi:hypothetical protein FUAX_37930 [Fulvitalea axinellae]|uniref:Fibronectin type-III domain-containing protein n=1 Tax=Fulvitalea axinellae TaxID=1182444 RepID=A0AAU9CGR0_9BACT|nr:hypothetical protein FUAX_37930 [Fulvitalea axinellae]
MKPRIFFLMTALLTLALCAGAQTPHPKREVRAAWIASAFNIDWPSKPGLDGQKQREEFLEILDSLSAMNINTVIVQVRPVSDTFYPSSFEPWSEFLTGKQGDRSPGQFYNPMRFMVEETHRRNMEFHAWFNPFRATAGSDTSKLSSRHPMRLHPEWFVKYGNRYYYNPGSAEARAFVTSAVMEAVRHYDIDAVHMDDYFYPYPVRGQDFPDEREYLAQTDARIPKPDWRRANVTAFVSNLSYRIRSERPHVKFGISPFGVWRNKSQDPNGSDSRASVTNYDHLFADVLLWLRKGMIDYVAPQLYWSVGYNPADYAKLLDWWAEHSYGRQLFIGQALYKVGDTKVDRNWGKPDEIMRQIDLNRQNMEVCGNAFFSSRSLLDNPLGVAENLKSEKYRHPAIIPVMPWKKEKRIKSPKVVSVEGNRFEGIRLKWKEPAGNPSVYYVIYRTESDTPFDPDNPANILAKIRRVSGEAQIFTDRSAKKGKTYTYAISAVSRQHRESPTSQSVSVKLRRSKTKTLNAFLPL